MEAIVPQALQFSSWIPSERVGGRPGGSVPVSRPLKDQRKLQVFVSARFPTPKASDRRRNVALEVSCSYKNFPGMMGSGKTTVGKILSQVLGYSFSDCDTLIEQEASGISVADIFKLHREGFFRIRDKEEIYA